MSSSIINKSNTLQALAIEYFARIAKTNPDARGILKHILRDQLEADLNLMQEKQSNQTITV